MPGDPVLFDDFVAARSQALVRTAYLLCSDRGQAEDLVQTALEKAWRRWHRIGSMDNVEGYVRRIVVTTYLGRRRLRESSVADLPDEVTRPDHAGAVAGRYDLERALRSLPRGQRAVLVLRFYEDLTVTQTAALLGCSAGTIKSQTARALRRLREDPAFGARAVD